MLSDLRLTRPDVLVHGAACPWGPVTAAELGGLAVSLFTTMAFGRRVPSPARTSRTLLAEALTRPRSLLGYLRVRLLLARRDRTRGLPPVDLVNARQPLNLVFTSRVFQPEAASSDRAYRFTGCCAAAAGTGPGARERSPCTAWTPPPT